MLAKTNIAHTLARLYLRELDQWQTVIRPRGYKKIFMLNSAEHEICPANKSQITNNGKFFHSKLSMKISLLINMKMPTIVGIFIFISRENSMLS